MGLQILIKNMAMGYNVNFSMVEPDCTIFSRIQQLLQCSTRDASTAQFLELRFCSAFMSGPCTLAHKTQTTSQMSLMVVKHLALRQECCTQMWGKGRHADSSLPCKITRGGKVSTCPFADERRSMWKFRLTSAEILAI